MDKVTRSVATRSGHTQRGTFPMPQRRSLWEALPGISIPDPGKALLHLILLLVALVLLGVYIFVEKPGLTGAGWRALLTPNHPSNPIPEVTATGTTQHDLSLAEARRIGATFREPYGGVPNGTLDTSDQALELHAGKPLSDSNAARMLSAAAAPSSW